VDYWIDINDSQWRAGNQPRPQALYYAVQKNDKVPAIFYVNYISLYAGQFGQAATALRAGTEFNFQMWTLGNHSLQTQTT
jgi:hypothetical protein